MLEWTSIFPAISWLTFFADNTQNRAQLTTAEQDELRLKRKNSFAVFAIEIFPIFMQTSIS